MAREGNAGRRNAVLGLVILGHALLVVLFLQPGVRSKIEPNQYPISLPLFDISIPTSARNSVVLPEAITKAPEAKTLPSSSNGATADFEPGRKSGALSSSDTPTSQLSIDWYDQARQVANSQAESMIEEHKRACAEFALHGEQRLECRKYTKPDDWVPEPKKFGIDGGLPYVRLGKRCIVGLGFFGCGVGKLPEANGHVLDAMRDPDRPLSSVPDPND